MRVGVSNRVIETHVGGNSRYVFELQRHLPGESIKYIPLSAGRLRLSGRPGLRYLLAETAWPVLTSNVRELDVLHYPADTGAIFAGKVPIVTTVHGIASLHLKKVRSPTSERIWRNRVGRAVSSSDHVITVSASSAGDLMRAFNIPAGKVSVIPHGIDHSRFHPYSPDDTSHLAPLKLPSRFCLYLGNLDPRKNVDLLVQAFASTAARRVGAELVIAGKPAWGAQRILDAIRSTPNVTYLGAVHEDVVAPLMRRSTIFTFPSLYEGFGFPVLEAMACGTPVICSHRGSLAQVANKAAMVVNPDNVEEISQAVAYLWDSSEARKTFSALGLENASQYRWSTSARMHAEIFRAVAP